jgi:thioredoxin reductase (NADPH)
VDDFTEHELHDAAFPKLNDAQMTALGRCAGALLKHYKDGQKLIEVGERDFKFFVVKSGEIDVLDESGETPKIIAVLGRGEFTGDVSHLTGGPSLISAIARGDSEVYEVTAEGVREIINRFPQLGDIILQAFIARRHLLRESGNFTGLRVIGSRYSRDTHRIREFLTKNRVPFTWLDLEADPQVNQLLKQFGLSEADTPVIAWGRKLLLRNPSNRELAEALGIRQPLEHTVYDLVVVGAGPAGLAAAVYAASEGLNTIVMERTGPGGQAGRSMRIENYLGFPTGISGSELAERAVVQAGKFGARLPIPTPVIGLTFDNAYPVLRLDGGETVTAKCLLIATGADYRRLVAEGCEQFEGSGVYYAATLTEAPLCRGAEVVVVGGGNSAGQAAVFLASIARKVYLLIRGGDLYKDMSAYLVHRVEQTPNIEVLLNTEVRQMRGDNHLHGVEIVNNKTGERRTLKTPALFSFIGATPRTDWLPAEIERDDKSFIRTGSAVAQSAHWSAKRQPFLLETSRAGVFAAGDVRSGSVKRVASAVGEGAMAVMFVHQYLNEK